MTPQEIIAEYMNHSLSQVHLYHSCWNSLMEVIKKLNETTLFGLFPKLHYMDNTSRLNYALSRADIETAYNEVINIITASNKRKKDEKISN